MTRKGISMKECPQTRIPRLVFNCEFQLAHSVLLILGPVQVRQPLFHRAIDPLPALPLFGTGHCYVAMLALNFRSPPDRSHFFILFIMTLGAFICIFLLICGAELTVRVSAAPVCVLLGGKVYSDLFPFKIPRYFLTIEMCAVLISF